MASMQSAAAAGGAKPATAADQAEIDPKFDWLDNATSYVLKINLPGFKKEEFRVQVDGAGKLTVRGQRAAANADGKHVRFHKVFQLPPTANVEEITGRFEASVLILTVPKLTPPATIQDIKKKDDGAAKPAGNKQEKVDDGKARKEEDDVAAAKAKASSKKEQDDTKPRKNDDEVTKAKPKEEPAKKKESEGLKEEARKKTVEDNKEKVEDNKEKEEEASMTAAKRSRQEQKPTPAEEQVKPKAEPAAAAAAEKQAVDQERVKRRPDEERAKVAAAAAAESEREKTMANASSGWKERVVGELAEMKWAEGLVETAKQNKEVIAVAVAAFSLGLLVSQKLFSRR